MSMIRLCRFRLGALATIFPTGSAGQLALGVAAIALFAGCGRQDAPPKERATLFGHAGGVYCLAVTADGKTLASGSGDNTVKLWDVDSGREKATLTGHTEKVVGVAISADGNVVVSGSWDGTAKAWNVPKQELLATFDTHTRKVRAVAVTPDGKTAISASEDETIKLWDIPARKEAAATKERATLTGHTFAITCLAISEDGKTLASGSQGNDRSIKLWDLTKGALLRTLPPQIKDVTSVAFSPNAQLLASGGLDESAHLWDSVLGQPEFTLERRGAGAVWSVAFSPDGKTLATAHANGSIKLWDLETRKERIEFRHSGAVIAVIFLPDGKTLASASGDRTIRLWDVPAPLAPSQ